MTECSCDGSGWTLTEQDGVTVACRCKPCLHARITSMFGGEERTWQTWQPRPALDAAVRRLRAWSPGGAWCVILHAGEDGAGNLGTGKTHAMQAVAHAWAEEHGIMPLYVVVPEYIEALRRAMDGDDVPIGVARHDGLLLLDDLGAEKASEWTTEVAENIAAYRHRHSMPTLIATNLNRSQLDVRYPRLADRAHEGLMITWSAPSWRRQ